MLLRVVQQRLCRWGMHQWQDLNLPQQPAVQICRVCNAIKVPVATTATVISLEESVDSSKELKHEA